LVSVFFSYSHADEVLRDQLEKQLSMLKRQGVISVWHDRRIMAGQEIDHAISDNLETAEIILLLVSSDFLASDYCYDREMTRAMERHVAGEAVVIPVILRACDWHHAPFGKLLATPTDGKPITQWPDRDQAFLEVARAIRGAAQARVKAVTLPNPPLPLASFSISIPKAGTPISAPRSSNLRVTKQFTERDKDAFRVETFDYIARYFENSLNELSARNPGIDGNFRRIDANQFTSVIYRDGRAVARCSIFMGTRGFGGGIAYANNDSGAGNSFNESLTVEHDDQSLFLRSLGMSMRGTADQKLSQEGAAELYWAMFIDPLQRGVR
jgi:hypothetical protein